MFEQNWEGIVGNSFGASGRGTYRAIFRDVQTLTQEMGDRKPEDSVSAGGGIQSFIFTLSESGI